MKAWLLAGIILIVSCVIGAYYVNDSVSGILEGFFDLTGSSLRRTAQENCNRNYQSCMDDTTESNSTCTAAYNLCNEAAQRLSTNVSTVPNAARSRTTVTSAQGALANTAARSTSNAPTAQDIADWRSTLDRRSSSNFTGSQDLNKEAELNHEAYTEAFNKLLQSNAEFDNMVDNTCSDKYKLCVDDNNKKLLGKPYSEQYTRTQTALFMRQCSIHFNSCNEAAANVAKKIAKIPEVTSVYNEKCIAELILCSQPHYESVMAIMRNKDLNENEKKERVKRVLKPCSIAFYKCNVSGKTGSETRASAPAPAPVTAEVSNNTAEESKNNIDSYFTGINPPQNYLIILKEKIQNGYNPSAAHVDSAQSCDYLSCDESSENINDNLAEYTRNNNAIRPHETPRNRGSVITASGTNDGADSSNSIRSQIRNDISSAVKEEIGTIQSEYEIIYE